MQFIKIILLLIVTFRIGYSQNTIQKHDTIRIHNGSFEVPSFEESKWIILGDKRFSPPDIHSPKEVIQNVKRQAQDGFNFISMVVRSNDSFEQIGQYLEFPLEAGQTYQLSFHAMQAPEFLAMSSTKELDPHSKAIVLKVCGLNLQDDEDINPYILESSQPEFLYKSEPIQSTEWKEEIVILKPTRTTNFIAFMAYYETPVLMPYNGHLLLDNISDLIKIEE